MDAYALAGLRYYLASSKYQGECKFEELESLEGNLQLNEVKSTVLRYPRLFTIIKDTADSSTWSIRVKMKVAFCPHYHNGNCSNDSCRKLHLCKSFVLGKKFCPETVCKYGFSHNIDDSHNSLVILAIGNEFKCCKLHEKLNIIRNSFARVCPNILNDGHCSKIFCGKLHICPQHVIGDCRSSAECRLVRQKRFPGLDIHDLSSAHNKSVLKSFGLNYNNKDMLLTNILVKAKDPKWDKRDVKCNNLGQVSFIHLCHTYLSTGYCKQSNCDGLHICKELLIDYSNCSNKVCKFGFSHDILNNHNKKLLDLLSIVGTAGQVIEIIRERLPRICTGYLNVKDCCTKICQNLHICPNYVYGRCSDSECIFSHDLKDSHNSKVLQILSFNCDDIATNILYSKITSLKPKSMNTRASENNFSRPSNVTTIEDVSRDPCEREIFIFILNNFANGRCKLTDKKLLSFFEDDPLKAEKWFTKHLFSFRSVKSKDEEVTVHVCLKNFRPCHFYWSKNGCKNDSCRNMHLCRSFVLDHPHSAALCKYSHDLKSPRETRILKELKLDNIEHDHLLFLLRFRFPYVCIHYIDHQCELGEAICPDLHICYQFMLGKCKKQEGLCQYKHESALKGEQAGRLIKEFHLNQMFFRCLIYLPKREQSSNLFSLEKLSSDFNTVKEEGICQKYVANHCDAGRKCHLFHTDNRTPYMWQYRFKTDDSWRFLPAHINQRIEQKYCVPAIIVYECDDLNVMFDDINSKFSGSYKSHDAYFRRLSTKSLACSEEGSIEGATAWGWFWCDRDGNWQEYSTGITSNDIEINFLFNFDVPMTFKANQSEYIIHFITMKQDNLDKIGSTRDVRRRPIYTNKLKKTKKVDNGVAIPSHWPSSCSGNGERIAVRRDIYVKLETEFKASIRTSVNVISIQEVINKGFHEKYEIKKKNLSKKLYEVNEKYLYHGTEYGIVDAICVQNFDFRLCGKNATVYGCGSYFATDASYSHSYTSDDALGLRYMFLAKVLVGQYTKGSPTFKRPPTLPSKDYELYDSCVNDVKNPSIFIVFERDQCYPSYLISYKLSNSGQSTYTSSFSISQASSQSSNVSNTSCSIS